MPSDEEPEVDSEAPVHDHSAVDDSASQASNISGKASYIIEVMQIIYSYIYNEKKEKYILFMNIIVLIICFLVDVGQEVGEPSTAGRQSNAEAVT